MIADDKLAVATAEAKNAVETYIYSLRDKLGHELKEYASDAEKEEILPVLQVCRRRRCRRVNAQFAFH